ncbi:MAG TPA: gamma-glutamyltransferase [Gaiellaceae bacterium]|jgi:gamma-glutamyltranspeptidase/glutathione hydrolase
MIRAAVAAGHPATAAAGAEVLADGGNAADAAIAACLASCVAETVMTGLLGGGHLIYHDATAGLTRNLDCFVTVPSGSGAPMQELRVPFGEELVHYAIGASSCGVPGVPAGLGELWRAHGTLPWPRLVEPALRLARDGVPMPPAHVACLLMLEPVMTLGEGATIYAPGGRLLAEGELLQQPGLTAALTVLQDEGPASMYTGTLAASLLELVGERGGVITATDLAVYRAEWSAPVRVHYAGRNVSTRGGLAGITNTLAQLVPGSGSRGLLAALEGGAAVDGHTTNLTVVDASGNACVITTSLGLGSGDWLPGYDLHLNSMLGETDLVRAPLVAGERMASMMAPTLVFDADGLELAAGAAGGTRLRTALVGTLAAILDEGLLPQDAVSRPRFHPAPDAVQAEPGVDSEFLVELEREGRTVRRWPALHHYFGGVSVVGRSGAAADPRRSGGVAAA